MNKYYRWLGVWGLMISLGSVGQAQEPLSMVGAPEVRPAQVAFVKKDLYAEPAPQWRIVSYNIQDFSDGVDDGDKRTVAEARRQARTVAGLIDEMAPDLLVLQEIENAAVLELINSYVARPFASGYITAFGEGNQRWNKLNQAVLSRVPIRGATTIDFTPIEGRGRPTRGLLRFEMSPDDSLTLLVYVVHLKANWGDNERNIAQRRHALRLLREDAAEYVKTIKGPYAVIVAGDFNVDPEVDSFKSDPSLEALNDMIDTWKGRALEERITVPTRRGDPAMEFPPVAFDRFYATEGLTHGPWTLGRPEVLMRGVDTGNVFRIAGEDDTTASDHYPVYIDLIKTPEK